MVDLKKTITTTKTSIKKVDIRKNIPVIPKERLLKK